MNRNTLYVTIGGLAIAAAVFGHQLYQSGRKSRMLKLVSAMPSFPSKKK